MSEEETNNAEDQVEVEMVNVAPSIRYAQELRKDLELNMRNIRDQSLSVGSNKGKWIEYLARERDALMRLNNTRSEYQKQMMAKAKGANAFEKLKNSNQDDEILKKIDMTKKNIEGSIEVITHAITALSEFGYNIKNFIDYMKLSGG